MLWKITCYNGTVWEAKSQMLLTEAIEKFIAETKLTQLDIRRVENLH